MCRREGALADLDHNADSQGAQVAAGGAMHAYADASSLDIARMLQDLSLPADQVADIMSGGAMGGPLPTDSTAALTLHRVPLCGAADWDFSCAMQRWDAARNHNAPSCWRTGGYPMTNIWSHKPNAYCPGISRADCCDCAGRSSNPHTNQHNQSSTTVIAMPAVLCLVHSGMHLAAHH